MAYGLKEKDFLEAISKSIQAVKMTNPKTFKRAVYNAKYKGYLEKKEDYYKITALGEKRLKKILPRYEKDRPWDGKLYLITYDIPEDKKRERDYLRDYLKKLGCGRLQQSVWLTAYNPTKLISSYVGQRKLAGLVLVSDLKEGGFIGGKKAPEIVKGIYNLETLNDQYRQFCLQVENKKIKNQEIIIEYLSILKKDSQLPFELLPGGWWGEDAYLIYQKTLKNLKDCYNLTAAAG